MDKILITRTDNPEQTVKTLIRLLLKEQSDQLLHYLPLSQEYFFSLGSKSNAFKYKNSTIAGYSVSTLTVMVVYRDRNLNFNERLIKCSRTSVLYIQDQITVAG